MRLKKKTREIFERCYSTSGWMYNDAIFLSKKYNWEKFKQYGQEKQMRDEYLREKLTQKRREYGRT